MAEDYTDTEVADAKAVGLDIYTTIKNAPLLLTSGVNEFTDNRYNLISFQNDVQTRLFNLLKGTATKIPQTEQGIKQIETAAEKECALRDKVEFSARVSGQAPTISAIVIHSWNRYALKAITFYQCL